MTHPDTADTEISAADLAAAGAPAAPHELVYELPDRAQHDPWVAAVLAVYSEIERQSADSGSMVALDPEAITRAAFESDPGGGSIPRVPKFDGQRRSVGGGTPAGHEHPQPTVEMWVGTEGGMIGFDVTMFVPGPPEARGDRTQQVWTPATDAEGWFLAGLAAVRRARELAAAAGLHGGPDPGSGQPDVERAWAFGEPTPHDGQVPDEGVAESTD